MYNMIKHNDKSTTEPKIDKAFKLIKVRKTLYEGL